MRILRDLRKRGDREMSVSGSDAWVCGQRRRRKNELWEREERREGEEADEGVG